MTNYDVFSERSKCEIVRQGWDIAEFCKRYRIPRVTFYRNHSEVKSNVLLRVADGLGVSTDYLLGRTDDRSVR